MSEMNAYPLMSWLAQARSRLNERYVPLVRENPRLLETLAPHEWTQEICMQAVQADPALYKKIPTKLRTEAMAAAAVARAPDVIKHVDGVHLTPRVVCAAVATKASAITQIAIRKEFNGVLFAQALETNPAILTHLNSSILEGRHLHCDAPGSGSFAQLYEQQPAMMLPAVRWMARHWDRCAKVLGEQALPWASALEDHLHRMEREADESSRRRSMHDAARHEPGDDTAPDRRTREIG